MVDGYGIYGHYLHYSLVISSVGSAFIIFVHLWRKKNLHMDESPKYIVLEEENLEIEQKDLHE